MVRLVLLPSSPDTVHGISLHKTLGSTPLTAARLPIRRAGTDLRYCYSGLQLQGTASSPPSTARILYQITPRIASGFLQFGTIHGRFSSIFALSTQKTAQDTPSLLGFAIAPSLGQAARSYGSGCVLMILHAHRAENPTLSYHTKKQRNG